MAEEKIISQNYPRPPVVVVLGHVDHGKTSLLDKIRQSDIASREFGGITQHIGAYQVRVRERNSKEIKTITFIDTPGHEAFSQMRSRGAEVADVAVLVVAADEGVKPQTLESLKFIERAKIPYLVAINKVDLPNIDINRLKREMAKEGIVVEDQGGDIVSVEVSAKTGKGIDELLEMLLLIAEMQELKGSVEADLEGVVIESKLDNRKGPLATILIRNGSLKIGDQVAIENLSAKVRAMFDENGLSVKIAEPSKPVEVLGFKSIPPVGGLVKKINKIKDEKLFSSLELPVLSKTINRQESETKEMSFLVKADTSGTLEAILAGLPENLKIIGSGIGEISESDILLAQTTGAEIIAFNVKLSGKIRKLAEIEGVKINNYQIIYKLFEEIGEKIKKSTREFAGEEILGRAEILQEFIIKREKIAGCRVVEGEIKKSDKLHLVRQGQLVGNCRIRSMKIGKEDVEKVSIGEEFGLVLLPSLDFRIGDMLLSYKKIEE